MTRLLTTLVLPLAVGALFACGGAASSESDVPARTAPPSEPSPAPVSPPGAVDLATPQLIAEELDIPTSLAVDADGVYWTSVGLDAMGSVHAWSKAASHETAVLASAQPAPYALAASSGALFWANGADGRGAIMSVSTRGGAPSMLTAADAPEALVPAGDLIYFLEEHGGGTISTVPRAGGARSLVATVGAATGLASDGRDLFYMVGQVIRIPVGGGSPARLSESCFYPVTLAIDDTQVFYGCQDGTLRAAPKVGGATRTLFHRDVGGGSISGIALDAANVYFTSTSDGTINRVSKQGGAITVLASGETGAGPIAVDDVAVYYGTRGAAGAKSAVKRVAK